MEHVIARALAGEAKKTKEKARPWVSARGIALLRNVQERILAHPNTYRQDVWHCGTACCIAGHVALASGRVKKLVESDRWDDEDGEEMIAMEPVVGMFNRKTMWADVAQKALGSQSTQNLFQPADYWPEPFASQWKAATSQREQAQIACRRIDHFIETGF